MTTDTANDRREGYCDGLSRKWQPGRSAAYNVANIDGRRDDEKVEAIISRRRANASAVATVSAWQRAINWLRAMLS